MLGHSHAMSGLAVGAATLPLAAAAGVTGVTAQIAWTAAVGGLAMLPDLDQGGITWKGGGPKMTGSTVARMWGPVTTTAASLVGKAARGHRAGTHDPVLAPGVAGGAAFFAAQWAPGAVLVVALAIGLALQALHVVIPGRLEQTVIGNAVASFGLAWVLVYRSDVDLAWLPWAVALGVLVHIAGDWLTVGGVPVPFTWFDGKPKRVAAGLFKTGAGVEHWLAGAFAVAAAVLLSGQVALEAVPAAFLVSLTGGDGGAWWLP